jgi:hypothetical protein
MVGNYGKSSAGLPDYLQFRFPSDPGMLAVESGEAVLPLKSCMRAPAPWPGYGSLPSPFR